MNRKPNAGLLPLYIALYDEISPDTRADFETFLDDVAAAFEKRGITIARVPICCVATEFEDAVAELEKQDVDCILTLHLAYSPSLESIDSFTRTSLPIVILDTTMDADFGRDVSVDRIMYNHGIHGVMDFASMLRRRGREFEIVAGHWRDPGLLDGAADLVRSAYASRAFGSTRALRVGEAFVGMGDFSVEEDILSSRLGITVNQVSMDELDRSVSGVADTDIEKEIASDRQQFSCDLGDEVHARSVRVGLGLRNLLEAGPYDAFSVNFQVFDSTGRPANTMPFLEISKAMARGIGYGGEGDVLTASLVGALCRAFGAVTFTEIFCPDWSGNTLFLSHMGEISPAVAGDKPRISERPFPFGGGLDPAVLTCAVKTGPATFVNLAPGPDNTFSLIIAPLEVMEDTTNEEMKNTVRAWVRPSCAVERFLEEYSRFGGTHHSALVLGDRTRALKAFATFAGLTARIIR